MRRESVAAIVCQVVLGTSGGYIKLTLMPLPSQAMGTMQVANMGRESVAAIVTFPPHLAVEEGTMSDEEGVGGGGGDMSEHDIMRTLRALSRQSQDLPQTLRGLLGQFGGDLPMMFGAHNPQFRNLLEKIQPSNAPHVQMASLSELCEQLTMSSSEEMLALSGFRADAFVPVLATLVAAPPSDSMDILLLACRALATILDVMPSAVDIAVAANVVASLCDKLLNIEYMDVAELALRMLERLCSSSAGRAAALHENGVVALLQFVDFFAVDVQRTAARTAALLCTDATSIPTLQSTGGLQLVHALTRSFDADIVYHGIDCLDRLCTSLSAQGNDADLSNTLVVVIDLNTLDHLLALLATYPTTSRMPDNMKPATYGLLVHILSVVGRRVYSRRLVDGTCDSVSVVLCAMLAAQDPPSVVRAALHFIDDVIVSLSSSSSDNTLCELADHMLTTKLVPAMLSSLAGLADPMDDDDAADTRARLVDVLTAAMTTVSHRALKHVDALCSFVATTLKRPRRRRRHVASVGAVDDEKRDDVGSTEVSLALCVMSIALTHAHDEYHVRFVRDGVYQALEGVAHEPPVATANTHAATQLLATYKSNATTTPALDALAALARDLRGGSSNAGVGAVVLRLADVFRSPDGVTSYELTTSAVVPALVEFIQASTDDFGEMVATMSDVRWVVALVATVKEAVVSQWNPYHLTRPGTDGLFPSVVASMTTSGRPVAHVMNLLAQHLNVRLHVNAMMGSPAIADTTTTTTVVLVEPLARVDTMQAFVAAKMFGKDQHHHNDDDDEEDVTEMQEGDGEDKARIRTTVDGHVLPPSMTILEALIRSKTCGWTNDYEGDEDLPWVPVESLWDAPMDLTFHMAATTPPNETPTLPVTNCHDDDKNARGSVVDDCLALLALLYKMSLVPPTAFESPALAMHLQRTCLMQPLVVALQAFPWAVRTIAHSYSFLLPFQAKLHLMYASSFGSARAIQYLSRTLWKLPGGRRPDATGSRRRDDAALAAAVARVAKIPRLKVRVARSKLLQSAMKLLSTYGGQKSIVEIEYLGEVGTGLGPTTEFYSLVSQAMQAKHLNMWRDEQSSSATADAESEPPAAAIPPQEPPPHHAMPVRGFHRVVVIVCNTCAHLSIPTCPTHQCLLTQPNDGSHSSSSTPPSGTPEPHCHACSFSWSMHQCRHATATSPSLSGSLDTENGGGGAAAPHSVSWRWWIVSDSEVAYLSQAYPRGTPSVVHPVLQCSHCDTVTFPGTEAGLVTMVDGGTRMVARTGRRMYERDYRAVTKHASVHCEGTPLTQTNVVLYELDVDTLVALVPQSPEVLDTELDGLGITSSFHTDLDDAVEAPHGLFPRPIDLHPPSPLSSGSSSSELLARFAFLGKLVAQALVDERLLDLPLAVPFLRLLRGESLHGNMALALEHIATVDPQLGRSLQYLYDHRHDASIDDMGLTFVLPPSSMPLCDKGADRPVTTDNVVEFLDLTVTTMLDTAIRPQVDAFRAGFASIAPLHVLTMLSAADWSVLLADPSRQMWPGGADEIRAAMVCDHGYTMDSRAIGWLVDILAEFSPDDQRLFVRFVTGSHRLPMGGLARLDPALTVVRKLTVDDASSSTANDAILPSASTCTNYLKLPDYSSKDIMRTKLLYCIHEGQLSFHLS
ncbi:hypothetical protein H257_13671 [Aphanomyces astaci]|uniref:HECT-type E3 ubiquitin transferase n=1 Tax=Aphanomyces astaci TaxID=112090 RepID=W4FVS2_APHAT|nr:hypothetical protein H257_13671 [Aphanomyces astaci]ETV70919.1 hypothetical protein H257_13671 [Aphanomyces astaci]|eukprot:XP_009839582.1 hypothetical protein H257_13671 [Aphanomyces astaci]